MSSHSDHAFTIGVEEEYQIIDPVTRRLCSDGEIILAEATRTLGKEVQPEIHLSQIEVATPICHTLEDVRREVARLRRAVIQAAILHDRRIVSAATHPFSHWTDNTITPQERYLSLEREYQQLAREQSIFGCHVHIGIQSRTIGIQIMNHARVWIATLLALSANSPFWWGTDTGYASFRTEVWSRWPFSGPPQIFESLAEYEQVGRSLVTMKSIEDTTKIYWDIRLSERFNTIEFRITDVCTTLDHAVMIAGLVQALVRTCYEKVQRGEPWPTPRYEVIRAANWRAARHGIDAELIDPQTEQSLPAQQLIEKFLTLLQPALEAEGNWQIISTLVRETITHGNGATRQRQIHRQSGKMEAVVDFLIAETARNTEE